MTSRWFFALINWPVYSRKDLIQELSISKVCKMESLITKSCIVYLPRIDDLAGLTVCNGNLLDDAANTIFIHKSAGSVPLYSINDSTEDFQLVSVNLIFSH
jgi:hypothetical protein